MPEEIPPDSPAEKPRKSFGWHFWLLLVAVIAIMGFLTRPKVIRSPRKSDLTEAVSNLRQIGLALFEFETEYGAYPNDETRAEVKRETKSDLDLSGSSSNALFRQLIAANIIQSEQMFYAKGDGIRKPDGDIAPGHALESGEVGFGYIAGLKTEGNPSQVLAFCPIIPGTDRFDPKPFDGKAVVLRIDNSVTSLNINKEGDAMVGPGKLLFETGSDTIWGEQKLDIRYPEIPAKPKPSFFKKLFSK